MKAEIIAPEDLTLDTILTHFSTDEKARVFLETWLWPNGPVCPKCGTNDQARIGATTENKKGGTRAGLYRCNDCRRTFTVTVGTIFEDSHLPLRKWLVAWFLICSSKKGISALQLQRILDIGSYRTAHFMSHRIRHALKPSPTSEKMTGTIEIDECYHGPRSKGVGFKRSSKSAVVALVDRKTGKRRSVVIGDIITANNLRKAVRENVAAGATIHTDEHPAYKPLKGEYRHEFVTHGQPRKGVKREFHRTDANGEVVSTNYAESSFSLLRRGVIGTFHTISRKHLPLYVAEFDHRWNSRKDTDGERTIEGLKMARGKRLTYRAIKGAKI